MNQFLTILAILALSQLLAFTFAPGHPLFMAINAIVFGGMGLGAYFVGLAQGRKKTEAARIRIHWIIAVVVIVIVSQFFALFMTPADPASMIIGSTVMSGFGIGSLFTGLARARKQEPAVGESDEDQ